MSNEEDLERIKEMERSGLMAKIIGKKDTNMPEQMTEEEFLGSPKFSELVAGWTKYNCCVKWNRKKNQKYCDTFIESSYPEICKTCSEYQPPDFRHSAEGLKIMLEYILKTNKSPLEDVYVLTQDFGNQGISQDINLALAIAIGKSCGGIK